MGHKLVFGWVIVLCCALACLSFFACDDDDDDDSLDDDHMDDDTIADDDLADDDIADDDVVDDDVVDDDVTDDDLTDDDVTDDDAVDDDIADDDAVDDDVVDDDVVDDDVADDDTTITEPMIETVMPGRIGYNGSGIAVQPDGTLAAVATGERRLYLYTITPDKKASFVEEVLAEWLYKNPAITVDDLGHRHIVVVEDNTGELVYFTDRTGTWEFTNLTPGEADGYMPHLAHDAAGFPHLAYRRDIEGERKIVYANNVSGDWVHTVINPAGQVYNSFAFAVDGDGYAHIAYMHYTKVMQVYYATNRAGAWTAEPVITGPTADGIIDVSLFLDDDDHAHISYNQSGPGDASSIHYTTNQSGAWDDEMVEEIDNPDYYLSDPALVVDSAGTPHVYYLLWSGYSYSSTMHYAYRDESENWIIDGSFAGAAAYINAVIDPSDKAHLLYYRYDGSLRYRDGMPDPWSDESLCLHSSVPLAGTTPLAINPLTGRPHVAFQDIQFYNVNHADKESGEWLHEQIGYAGVGGYDPDVDFDNDGYVHLVYSDWYDNKLIHVTNRSGEWESSIVDETYSQLLNPNVAIDDSGVVHVAYYCREYYHYLRYANDSSGSWQNETILADQYDHYIAPKIEVAANGDIFIAFEHMTSTDPYTVELAEKSNSDAYWTFETIDDFSILYSTNLRLDSAGNPHLTYVTNDPSNGIQYAHYARRSGDVWTISDIGQAEISYIALDLDDQDFAHVTYVYPGSPLYYATNMTGDWIEAVVDSFGAGRPNIKLDQNDMVHSVYYHSNTLWHLVYPKGYTEP